MMKNYKQITCMVADRIPISVLKKLKEEKGIITADKTDARGSSSNSNFEMKKMQILTVVVEDARADEIFEYLYHILEIDQPDRGIMLQSKLARMTEYTLPEINT